MGLSVLIVLPDADDDDSGMERGDGVRGGLEMDVRGWKKFGWVVNAGMSLERRRPRTEAGDVEDGAGVGIGICSSGGGSCRPIIEGQMEMGSVSARQTRENGGVSFASGVGR
jgi:hypothetical protein